MLRGQVWPVIAKDIKEYDNIRILHVTHAVFVNLNLAYIIKITHMLLDGWYNAIATHTQADANRLSICLSYINKLSTLIVNKIKKSKSHTVIQPYLHTTIQR